ncbi:MAG TPA: hypothetical protein VGI81_00865 [Tepidisphaeraceae bacterium]|jgi:hypothetical protein
MAKLRDHWVGVVLVAAAFAVGAGVAFLRREQPPLAFDWDFSKQHEVTDVPWPASNHTDTAWWGARRVRLSMRIDQTRSYRSDDVADLYAVRRGTRLTSLTVDEPPATAAAAARRAAELIRLWGGDRWSVATAEGWRATAVPGSVQNYLMVLRGSGRTPEVCVQIFPAVATPSRPWHVMVEVYWGDR